MPSVNLSPVFNGITNFDNYGQVLAGGLIYTYQAGSSTPFATYTAYDGNTAQTNPIVLGADGRLDSELWLQAGFSYKLVLKTAIGEIIDTFDNIAGLITSIPSSTPSVPSGCILIWAGSTGSIPAGFVLCDGSQAGVPDLRNSFVLGAGNNYSVGQTGGTKDAVVVAHNHAAVSTPTLTDPGHVHPTGGNNASGQIGGNWMSSLNALGTNNTQSASTGITVTVATTIQNTGISGVDANLPPYYALAYIYKL